MTVQLDVEALVGRLRACANGMGSMKSRTGDYGIFDDAADEIERLRGLLIDPGSPPWEDARAVLVAELRKGSYSAAAYQVSNAQGCDIPSYVALNLIAQAASHIAGEDARVAAAVAARDAEWSGVASRLNKSVAGLESAIRETPSAE